MITIKEKHDFGTRYLAQHVDFFRPVFSTSDTGDPEGLEATTCYRRMCAKCPSAAEKAPRSFTTRVSELKKNFRSIVVVVLCIFGITSLRCCTTVSSVPARPLPSTYTRYRTVGRCISHYHIPLGQFFMVDISTVATVSVPKQSGLETPRRELSDDVPFGIGTLLVDEQSSLENRARGVLYIKGYSIP